MKKQGVLIYDDVIDRMDIRFGPLDYYGGLHCGERLEVLLDGEWIPTRIELGEFWYLKGVKLIKLNHEKAFDFILRIGILPDACRLPYHRLG